MTALRLACGVTGRPKVIKFAGNYHGHGDALLAAAGSGVATLGLSGSAGVTDGRGRPDRSWRRTTSCRRARRRRGLRHRRAGGRQHGPGRTGAGASSRGCGRPATAPGALLVFDEVITGFRLGLGGAGARTASTPDLHVLRQGHRRRAAHRRLRRSSRRRDGRRSPRSGPCTRPARCPGTRSPRPPGLPRSTCSTTTSTPSLAAGQRGWPTGSARRSSSGRADHGARSSARWSGLHFSATRRSTTTRPRTTDEKAYARFFHALLDEGVALAPGAYEVAFPGLAHDDSILDEVTAAATRAAATMT